MVIKLVLEQPEEEIAARRAREEVERTERHARSMVSWRLRDLTANLIRVARGAGRPYEIEEQAAGLLEACEAYRESVGHGVSSDDIAGMLRVRHYLDPDREWTGEQHTWNMGEERMVAGALQIAASRLLGQGAQEARGHSEMFDGLQIIERQREENQRHGAATTATPRAGRGREGKGSGGNL
jgi:hypothetical protein